MLRLLVTPRWIGWTLLAVVAVLVCGAMAYWQLLRAESPTGSLLNAGYAFQWPLFGLFFAALWWRMLRAEARALAEVRADTRDDDVADEHNLPVAPAAEGAPAPTTAVPAGSPFGPRPAGVRPGGFDADAVPSPGRARYNAMLAELAARERTAGPTRDEESAP